jgi:hypothetical protein
MKEETGKKKEIFWTTRTKDHQDETSAKASRALVVFFFNFKGVKMKKKFKKRKERNL